MKPLSWLLWLCLAPLLLAGPALAQAKPEAVIAGIINALGHAMAADKESLAGDRALGTAQAIITRDVAPHMDFARITEVAVGKPWAAATPQQRAALEREFSRLLVRVLARLLVGSLDNVLEAQPTNLAPGATRALVRMTVTRQKAAGNQAGEPMQATLHRVGDTWKVLELRADGVDVVRLYSANFAVVIERNGGIDGLIRALTERNSLNEGGAAAKPAAN
jgi:phospholipid transport system substrate-binding protein